MKNCFCLALLPLAFKLTLSLSEKELVYKTKDTTVKAEEHRKDLKIRSKYAVSDNHRAPIKPDLHPGHPKFKPNLKPVDPDLRPVNPDLKPIDPDLKPVDPDLKPIDPNVKPVDPDLKPIDPYLKPTDPDLKPIDPDLKPVDPDLKPVDPDLKPVDPDLKPVDPDLNPTATTHVKKVITETKIIAGGKNDTKPPKQVTVTTKEQTSSGVALPEPEEGSTGTPEEGSTTSTLEEGSTTDSSEEDFDREFMEETLDDWNYVKIRGVLSQLNQAMYRYASNLTKGIIRGKGYLRRFGECSVKYKKLEVEYKAVSQDKIKIQEELDDLSSKFSTMKNILAKVRDINEDNRQLIDKLRANRDHCIQGSDSKMKTVYSLRSQAAELRRKLSHFRGSKK